MNKKIAFISEHASPLALLGGKDSGGQNVYVAELAKQLATDGYEIDVFTRRDCPDLPKVVALFPGVRVIHVNAGPSTYVQKEDLLDYMGDFRDDMFHFIQSERIHYQLIHANFWMSALVAIQLKPILNIPVLVTFHALGKVRRYYQQQADRFPESRIRIEEEIIRKVDGIIAECPQDQDDLMRLYQAPVQKLYLVPCGFSPEEFYPIDKRYARKVLGLGWDEKIILQLGRMVPRKGIDNVIESLKHLEHDKQKYRLVVVGGEGGESGYLFSPELQRLQSLVHANQLQSKVDFVGPKQRKELKYYYSAADIFVSTPWYEPFGITPLESMACGTPVIGANVGGIKYTVQDGVTGYLVPPKAPMQLAEKVKELFQLNGRVKEMRQQAILRANTLFTWEKVASSMKKVYRALVSEEKMKREKEQAMLPKLKELLPLKNQLDIPSLSYKKQHHAS